MQSAGREDWARRAVARFAALAAGVAIVCTSAAALARDHGGDGGRGHAPEGEFSDVTGGFAWAGGAVASLALQGVILGTGPGTFAPGADTTRAELAVVLGRLLGWQAGRLHAPDDFKDSGDIPSWARGDVALAAAQGLLRGEAGGDFAPGQAVTWAQASVVVARAFRLAPVAPADVAAELAQLPAGPATPAWAAPAVAADVAAGVFADQELRDAYDPGAAIDRADLAALVQAAEAVQPATVAWNRNVVVGAVASAAPGSLTVDTPHGPVTVTLAAGTLVYAQGAPADFSAVAPGDVVLVVLAGGVAVSVDVLSAPPAGGSTVSGTVLGVGEERITVTSATYGIAAYPLADGVTVTGAVYTLREVLPGDGVTLVLDAQGEVTTIEVLAAGGPTLSVSGTVLAVRDEKLVLDLPDGRTVRLRLAEGVSVTTDGQPADLSAVVPGAAVNVALDARGRVVGIDVTGTAATSTVSGTVTAVGDSELTLATASGTVAYPVAAGAVVTVGGQGAGLSDVQPGDQVTLTLDASGQAIAVADTPAGGGQGGDGSDS